MGTTGVRYAAATGAMLVLFCLRCSTPATAGRAPVVTPRPRASPSPRALGPALYSTHARRLVQAYLRLKLLEAREAELERVRKVVERRLGVGALFGETPAPRAW